MEALEVFEVSVEERVFVVPFDLEGDSAACERADMVDFVRLGFTRDAIDRPLNNEIVLLPSLGLRALRNL